MSDILNKEPAQGPRTHALVIGVSHYRHFEGGAAPTQQGKAWGMEQLSAAAASAGRVAKWLEEEYNNPDAKLQTLRVLLSPSPDDAVPPSIAGRAQPATRANVQAALLAFKNDCEASRDHVAFVYVAGHGVQLTKHDALVLLEDMGSPAHLNPLEGAIDMVSCHRGLDHKQAAANQCWFIDACRQRPEIAEEFENMNVGALGLAERPGRTVSSPLFFAASTREAAFARPGKQTLFCEALIASLSSEAAVGPEKNFCASWHVSTFSLNAKLIALVAEAAENEEEEQTVDPGGRMAAAVIHRFDQPPTVHVEIGLLPKPARATTTAALRLPGQPPVAGLAAGWPLKTDLAAGLYLLTLTTKPPFKDREQEISLRPPSFIEELEVES